VTKPNPIRTSQAASTGTESSGFTPPSVSNSIVRLARFSAGDKPGKNFRMPNQKKTIPRLTLRRVIPFRASHYRDSYIKLREIVIHCPEGLLKNY
jgi:hypothetical protein